MQWLIHVICSFHCDRKMFSSCFSRKTEYLHPKKAGVLLPFVKLFRLLTENGFLRTSDKIFWDVITTICPAPSFFALFINFLSEKQKIFLSCICVCNSLLTLWSFSKPMLTCVCCGLKLSNDGLFFFWSMIS